ncbi:cell adhesion molecule Dscam2-like [Dermacentor albipictus]|uniref:cell adhesion molecule Dscam2-like n=1 Tax=Dermacentor albipictus TaxID=60249 RepID=UPI0038FC9552
MMETLQSRHCPAWTSCPISCLNFVGVWTVLVSLLSRSVNGQHGLLSPSLGFEEEPPERYHFLNTLGGSLRCRGHGSPSPSLWWIHGDDLNGSLSSSSWTGSVGVMLSTPAALSEVPGLRHTSADGSTLLFPAFGASEYRAHVHSTSYRCVLSNALGKMASRAVRVRAVIQQEYEVNVHDGFATRGSTAVLTCQIQPAAAKDYTSVLSWLRDDKYLITAESQTQGKYALYPSGELYIHDVDERDAERSYRCQVLDHTTNATKANTRPARIILQGPRKSESPRVISWTKEVTVEEGQPVTLSCAARGVPLPAYHWFRQSGADMRPLLATSTRGSQSSTSAAGHQQGPASSSRGTLALGPAHAQDAGRYVCLVNNTYGEDRVYVTVNVRGAPLVSVQPRFQRVPLGASVTLTCNATGGGAGVLARELRWYRNLVPVQPSAADRVRLLGSSVLQLGSVKDGQEGIYQCLLDSTRESAQSSAFVLLMVTKPELTVTFTEQNTYPGSFVSLKCAARGHPMPRVTWTLDGGPVPSSRRVLRGDFVTEDHVVHSFVNLTSANVTHGGEYACQAENEAGRVAHAAWLNVLGPPTPLPPRNLTVLSGETLSLACPVKGHPFASFTWYKGAHANRTLVDGQRYRMNTHGRLTIHDVDRKTDDGVVVCSATSPDGRTAEAQVNLHVAVPPTIAPFSFPASVREGERASAHCFVSSGDRPVSLWWLKDGHPLQPGLLDVKPQLMNEFLSVLYFESIAEEHNGSYTCVASNPYARTNASAQLVVQVAPKWVYTPSSTNALKGSTMRFDCQADGFPTPVIRWKMSTGGVSSGFVTIRSNAKLQVLENGSLVLQHVDASDAGVYLCQATNGVGPELTHEAKLTVSVPATFITSSMSVTSRKGDKVHLQCDSIGDPPLTITWYRDNVLLDMDRHPRYTVNDHEREDGMASQLLLRDVRTNDTGTYACKVANSHGKDEMFIKLTVQEAPSPPTNVHVSHLASRSVSIRWSVPFDGNSPITQYDLKIHSSRDGTSRVIPIPGTQLEMTLDSLSPNSAYRVEVVAVNGIGTGTPSEPLFFTTDTEAPSTKPIDLKVIPLNASSLRVTWKMQQGDSKITGYYVGYKAEADGRAESFVYKTVESRPGKSQECDIKDLRPGTKYTVVVQAYNGKGPGPTSEETVGETQTSDMASLFRVTVNYTSSTEIRVIWHDIIGSRHGYKLFLRPNASDWEAYKVPGTTNGYTFNNLRCGTRYEIYVEAVGDSRPRMTSIITASTKGSVPVAPAHQQPLLVDSENVPLDLEAFGDGGCPIGHYVVKYRALDDTEWTVVSKEGSKGHVVALNNLERGRRYKLLLGAANSAGYTERLYDMHVAPAASKGVSETSTSAASQQEMHRKLAVVTSIVCSVVVLIVIIVAACVELGRRRRRERAEAAASEIYAEPRLKPASKCEEVALATWDKQKEPLPTPARNGELPHHHQQQQQQLQQQQLYAPCPYGTSSARMRPHVAEGTLGRRQHTRADIVEEFYDMPLPPYAVHRHFIRLESLPVHCLDKESRL